MPDKSHSKFRVSLPPKLPESRDPARPWGELCTTSNFSFLTGASHPEELVRQAKQLGYRAIALTDHNTLAGIVRAHTAAKIHQIQFIVGARLILQYSPQIPSKSISQEYISLLTYPKTRKGYGNLCALLTLGKRRAPKDGCLLSLSDLLHYQEDLELILLASSRTSREESNIFYCTQSLLEGLIDKQSLSLALVRSFTNTSERTWNASLELSEKLNLPLVATNDVYYHIPERRFLHDVVNCIRLGCSLQEAGLTLQQNSDRFLKPLAEMYRLFREIPTAIARTNLLIDKLSQFSLDELRYEYPEEIYPRNQTALSYLTELTYQGAHERYPEGIPTKVKTLLVSELKLIHELSYEKYFLTCYDITRFARARGILCQGRGAAANSAICYCLGITAVDPNTIDLLFARFVSKERQEPPDIDIDFENERRQEVIAYIYEKYGRHHAGLTATVITYRHRSAIRDIGKTLGLSLDVVDRIAKSIHRWTGCAITDEDIKSCGLDPHDKTIRNAFSLSRELLGFPRHLSQHVGGFIISRYPLSETVPIVNARSEERTIIEWDKDDIEALGMLKIDILALGMLTCIRKAFTMLSEKYPHKLFTLYNLPPEDPAVYDMLCNADTIGVFQVESRAQMSMLPRLRPRTFYDLVIEVAIVRPGPIQGKMVHPYLRRRKGLEKPHYPDTRVEEILGKTLGVPLFQEQAMRLAIVLANFTPDQAEALRRAIGSWKRDKQALARFSEKIINGMTSNGYTVAFAENCISQIKGFSEYGFPESHAASFAHIVYASAWIKHYYPAEFAAALLNSQPMGFYAPSQIVRDVAEHGVRPLPIDLNHSAWDTTVDYAMTPPGLRLGLRLVRGLTNEQGLRIEALIKERGALFSIKKIWEYGKGEIRKHTLTALARADCFRSLGLERRDALWEIQALTETTPLSFPEKDRIPHLTPLTLQQSMFKDYQSTGLSLKAHPIELIRKVLISLGVTTSSLLKNPLYGRDKEFISVAGISIVRQRPGTARGVVFITLEDETGITNLIIRPEVFEHYSKIIMNSSSILAHGIIQRVDNVIYVAAHKVESLDSLLLTAAGTEKNTTESPFPVLSYSY